jgi:hypothetical protein
LQPLWAGVPTTVYYHVLPVLLLNELQPQQRDLAALRELVAAHAVALDQVRSELKRIRR